MGNCWDCSFTDWHADCRRSTGLLLQKGVNNIDVVHWLADFHTIRVSAMGDRIGSNRWPPTALRELNDVADVEGCPVVLMGIAAGVPGPMSSAVSRSAAGATTW